MEILNLLLTIVYVFACLFLGFVVLIQKGEGGGLGGAFGGGAVDVAFGAKADMTWKRATAFAASLFMGLALFLGILDHQIHHQSIAEKRSDQIKKEAEEKKSKAGKTEGELPKSATEPGTQDEPGEGAGTDSPGSGDSSGPEKESGENVGELPPLEEAGKNSEEPAEDE